MKINKLKINSFGVLKEKEIDFKNHINIVYGKNETGKSTLLNFIMSCFYGISKNKNGKEISNLEKYTPWTGDDFSGKIEYELDNKEKFEVYRDFKKKNPQIFNTQMEDISKQFNIDKTKGNEFFYEQTKVDELLFLSTILVNQDEVKLEKQNQNMLVQKITNLVGTGQDNISYKKAIDKIDKLRLEKIGTQRSKEKPINIINRQIQELEEEKQELEKYETIKYNIEEEKNILNKQIENLENESKLLKQIKQIDDNEKIEKEKIKLKIDLEQENEEKIQQLKSKINNINSNNEEILQKNKNIDIKKKNFNKKSIVIFILVILLNILQFIFIKNKYFNYIFLITIPASLILYVILKNKMKTYEKNLKSDFGKVDIEVNTLNNEINSIEKNNIKLKNEIDELKNNLETKTNLEKQRIINNYKDKIDTKRLDELINVEDYNLKIQEIDDKLGDKKVKLYTLEVDYKNIEPKLENLSNIEEKLVNNKEKMVNLKNLEESMILAKEVLSSSYEKMKNTITPKFTKKLSEAISKITNGKYTNVNFNDESGLIVETLKGNYINISRLSIGTIDQLYLSMRLSMVEDLSKEKMPIILDEAFAYYDKERLKNILGYLDKRFSDYQIIIFTCCDREQKILQDSKIEFNLVEM